MVRRGFALFAAGALATGMATGASAQAATQGTWWNPMTVQATQESGGIGAVLRDAVMGRPSTPDASQQSSRAPNTTTTAGRGRGRGNGNGNGNVSNANARLGNGPPFCRNGQGHPTKGRAWCEQKGWVGNTTWAREGWGDVVFGGGVPSQERTVGQGGIGGVLGNIILGRLTSFGRSAGLAGSMDGRWIPLSSGGTVLQVRMGGVPIAELADLNRDGRADMVLLNHAY